MANAHLRSAWNRWPGDAELAGEARSPGSARDPDVPPALVHCTRSPNGEMMS